MTEATKLLTQFGSRIETILAKDPDPPELMSEILTQAEEVGLIDATGSVRTSSPMLFVMDLLTDNPAALEWAQAKLGELKPLQIKDRIDLLDAISPR